MIIYNVTTKVENAVTAEWLDWMKMAHIPDMLDTGLFHSCRMFRLLGQDDSEGPTYVIQYSLPSMEHYRQYLSGHAARMREKSNEKFGNKFVSFQTVMEEEAPSDGR